MTIQRVTHVTEITPGQWICMDSVMLNHIVSPPREVIRRSGKRVYYRNKDGVDDGRYCALSSVIVLCDTRDEAERVYAVSEGQAASLRAVREAHGNHLKFLIETSQ